MLHRGNSFARRWSSASPALTFSAMPSKIFTTTTQNDFVWAANSRPFPKGWPSQSGLGYDYVQHRARVLSAALLDAKTNTPSQLSAIDFHKKLQHSQLSGFWIYGVGQDLKLTDSTSTHGLPFSQKLDTAGANLWSNQMKKWDGVASKGRNEATDLWRWVFLMARIEPLTSLKRSWVKSDLLVEYVTGLIGNPTSRQQTLCANKVSGETTANSLSCARYAATVWNHVASQYPRSKWFHEEQGDDASYLVQHLILHGSIAEGLFSRKMVKGGDPTSLDILKLHQGTANDNSDIQTTPFIGQMGPSARWIFTKKTSADGVFLFSFPAGNDGNVFSKFYFNIAEEAYAKQLYKKMFHYANSSKLSFSQVLG